MNAVSTEFVATLTFFVGLGLGALIYHFLRSDSGSHSSNAQQKLAETEFELTRYREQVNDHFARTVDLLNSLNKNYQTLQQQLTEGARALCDDDSVIKKLSPQAQAESPAASAAEAFLSVEAPKDYAPKSANEAGTLSEEFGLKPQDKAQEAPETTDSASSTSAKTA